MWPNNHSLEDAKNPQRTTHPVPQGTEEACSVCLECGGGGGGVVCVQVVSGKSGQELVKGGKR